MAENQNANNEAINNNMPIVAENNEANHNLDQKKPVCVTLSRSSLGHWLTCIHQANAVHHNANHYLC